MRLCQRGIPRIGMGAQTHINGAKSILRPLYLCMATGVWAPATGGFIRIRPRAVSRHLTRFMFRARRFRYNVEDCLVTSVRRNEFDQYAVGLACEAVPARSIRAHKEKVYLSLVEDVLYWDAGPRRAVCVGMLWTCGGLA
jgi:hypothetical protein